MEKLKLSFRGQDFYATLLDEQAPKSVAALRSVCPFKSKLIYAKICENEVYFRAPINIDDMENPVRSTKRHIAFFPPKQGVCIWYRDNPTLADCNLMALLDEDQLDRFALEADKVWENQGCVVSVDIVTVEEDA